MIELKSVYKRFENKIIFEDLSYKFEENNIYIIQGQSGIGKTTLLNIIYGYDKSFDGNCFVDDGAKIAYMFQDDLLFNNVNVLENLKLYYLSYNNDLSYFSKKLETILKNINIDSLLNEKVQTLSGGEKQRVKLAQVLLADPNIILLDEPVSNLDTDNIKQLCSLIDDIGHGKTLIIVSHAEINLLSPSHKLILKGGKLYEE